MDTYSFLNKKIGIWGYGIVGKSTTHFFLKRGIPVSVMDKNELIGLTIAKEWNGQVSFFSETQKTEFFSSIDCLIPSVGFDISKDYRAIKDKLKFELDIFYNYWH